MKAAAILAAAILVLVYALLSGAWAINDYRNHEETRRDFARKGITYLSLRADSGKTMRLDVQKMESYYERHDAKVGAVSLTCLIGSIVLFWCRSRVVKPVDLAIEKS
jgi:hypothetical protein